MHLIRTIIFLILIAILPITCFSQAEKGTVITHITLIDVEQQQLLPDMNIFIDKDRISNISPATSKKSVKGYKVINGKGKYLMPGLIDSHLHIGRYLRNDSKSFNHALNLLLANGITGLRDAGMASGVKQLISKRDSIDKNLLIGPKIYVSGIANKEYLKVVGASNLTTMIDSFSTWGVNGIKIKRVTCQDAKEIIDAANLSGLPVYGHTYNQWETQNFNILGDFTSEAISYGIKGVMHSNGSIPFNDKILPVPPEPVFTDTTLLWEKWWLYVDKLWLLADDNLEKTYIKKVIDSNVWLEPTLSAESITCTYQRWLASKDLKYLLTQEPAEVIYGGGWMPAPKGAEQDSACMVMKRKQEFVKRFYNAGGTLLAGTDDGLYGYALRAELKQFVDAGIPSLAALKIATLNNAQALGWANDYGSLTTGKVANLIILSKNPIDDISNLKSIDGLFLNGKFYSKSRLKAWKRNAATYARSLKNT
jgi:hypothetical protein